MRQVEHGREGGAVAQARRGRSHKRVTAHAACRNLNHVADLTAQLRGENADVLLGGGQGFNSYAEAAGGACLQLFNGVFGANVSFGGTSLIIIVGVVLETIKKIESQMLVRNYTGFLNNKR